MDNSYNTKEKEISDVELSVWMSFIGIVTQDIAYAKQQQWRVTNWTLLAYAALAAVYQLLPVEVTELPHLKAIFMWLGLFLTGIAIVQLRIEHRLLFRSRKRLRNIYGRLPDQYLEPFNDNTMSAKDSNNLSFETVAYQMFILSGSYILLAIVIFFAN